MKTLSSVNSTVVIVTFNSAKTIKLCLDSLVKFSPNAEIIVVDNKSEDQTQEIVQRFDGKVKLIESQGNVGFAKANNTGVNFASNDVIIFLNPDTEIIEQDTLEKLTETLIGNTDYGAIGPKLIHLDGNIQKSVRNLPTVLGSFREYILRAKGAYDFYMPQCKDLCPVESIVGACIIMKKDIFQKIGGFDEKYFLYYEDLDLCKKIKKVGLKVGYLPSVQIKHYEGASGVNQKTFSLLQESAKKYHGLFSYYLINCFIRIGNALYG